MDDRLGVHVAYDESDIIKNCKYCRKVNKKSIAIGGAAYGHTTNVSGNTIWMVFMKGL